MRLAVYCDYCYRVDDGHVYAQLPFAVFISRLLPHCDRLMVTGRLDPAPGRYPYLMDDIEYVPLPHYENGAHMRRVLFAMPRSVGRFWRMLDGVDVVWVLGPQPPQAVVFAALSMLRGRRVVLGVRQNLPQLIRHRHSGKRRMQLAAMTLETAFRALSRVVPVVVVGPDLARLYRNSSSVHVAYVSQLGDEDIMRASEDRRTYDGAELHMLSVGRLDPEKNPLLLADVLAQALSSDRRWRLDVCGDGPLRAALAQRLEELGVAERATLHGYVTVDDGLWDFYRRSHAFVHVSFTEGLPQVLLEAFAARLPVVATSVGGVPELVNGCGLLVPPADAAALVRALERIASEADLRATLVERASERSRGHTAGAESASLATFLAGNGAAP